MKVMADENLPITAFKILRESGYDIKHVAYEMNSVADTDVIGFAISENRTRFVISILRAEYAIEHMHTVIESDKIRPRRIP